MAIFTAIGTALFGASTFLAAATATVLQAAAGIGLNLLAKAIAGKPEKPGFSVQGKLQSGGDVPRSFMLGYGATAGSLVYANSWGQAGKTPNAYFTQVICVGDRPVNSLAEVWANGEKVTLLTAEPHADMGYPVLEYRAGGRDHLWIKFYDGTQTVADSFLVSKVSSADRPYESTRVGVGCPYVIATSLVNEELFTGLPSYKFALNGVKFYDPSRDSTVGGSGAHRWSNPATWGGDGDKLPAVQIYNILRGMTASGQWFYGPQGMTSARLPAASWIAAINKCRATITSGGAAVPTYRSGGEISVSAPVADAVEAILTTCQGRLAETGGVYKLHVGAPGAASFAFTDGEILSTEEQSFTPFFGLADTINGIAAKYPSPAEGWNTKVAPPIYRTDLEALAGNRRLMADVSLNLVPYADQVQRLMLSALLEAQRARRHTLVLPPDYFGVEPGDVMAWTSNRNGYAVKLFRVDGVVDKANLDVMVDLTEVDPSDYDWDDTTDYRVPVDGPVGPLRPPPQQIVIWSVEAVVLNDNSGTARRPAIKFNWDADISDVKAVALEVRLAGTTTVEWRGRTDNVETGSVIVGPFLPDTNYEGRGRYIPTSNNRRTEWTAWLPVKTLDIKLVTDDILNNAITQAKIADAAITAAKIMDGAVVELKLAEEAVSTTKIKLGAVTEQLVANNAIVAAKLADNAVTQQKVADNAISTAKIANDAVNATKLADLAVSTSKLADSAITNAKLGALAVDAAKLATNAVTTTKIADDAITTPKLVANAIVADKIAANAVTAAHMVITDTNNYVEDPLFAKNSGCWPTPAGVSILNNPATAWQGSYSYMLGALVNFWCPREIDITVNTPLQINVVGSAVGAPAGSIYIRLVFLNGDNATVAVSSSVVFSAADTAWVRKTVDAIVPGGAIKARLQIYTNGVDPAPGSWRLGFVGVFKRFGGDLIVDGAIVADKIAANAVTTAKIAANAVTATEIAAGAIVAGKISANAVTTTTIAAGAVTATEIAAGAIVVGKIAANAVTTATIAAGAVTATEIATGAITAVKIAAGTITGDKIAANTIGAGQIAADSITTENLVVTDYQNVVEDPAFHKRSGAWPALTGATPVLNPATAYTGDWLYYINTAATTTSFYNARFYDVAGAEAEYRLVVVARGTAPGNLDIRVVWYDSSKAYIGVTTVIRFTSADNVYTRKTLSVTPPASAAYCRVQMLISAVPTSGDWRVGFVGLFKKAGGELIVDGSITADKMAANSITAGNAAIADAAITSAKIANAAITSSKAWRLQVGRLTA